MRDMTHAEKRVQDIETMRDRAILLNDFLEEPAPPEYEWMRQKEAKVAHSLIQKYDTALKEIDAVRLRANQDNVDDEVEAIFMKIMRDTADEYSILDDCQKTIRQDAGQNAPAGKRTVKKRIHSGKRKRKKR